MAEKNCRQIPGNSGCNHEMKRRKCPLKDQGGDCTGHVGGIGSNLAAAQANIKNYPERRSSVRQNS